MSKERELLEEIIAGDEDEYFYLTEKMFMKIKELLAQPEQPEQPEQEPIYIVGKGWQCDEMPEEGLKLYTAPPKREPLSDRAIAEGFIANRMAIDMDSYWAGISDAEKAYGIGGEE